MFSDKFGITDIIDEKEKFSIGWDSQVIWNPPTKRRTLTGVGNCDPLFSERTAVILYVPNKDSHQHHHIEMTDAQCETLRDWLTLFLESKSAK